MQYLPRAGKKVNSSNADPEKFSLFLIFATSPAIILLRLD
jgi:hypothetical protein